MTDVEAYERKRIKDMIRKMIVDELKIEFKSTFYGVEVTMTLGDEIVNEKTYSFNEIIWT